ncbi:MAG: cupin domain-containing protein, partial [Alphaproteobacteria bacterium]|nr:cupin domain-containing protein [Alphaproteobacteria bacterium]
MRERAMASASVSKSTMLKTRVARFKDLKAYDAESSPAFIDTVIPEYKRDLFSVIGKSVFENKAIGPAIQIAHPFSFGIIKMEPGQGGGLHAHETEEVFFPLNGRMVVCWGDTGENELVLEPWDTVSMPIGVMRGFRNPGNETLYVVAIVGGHDGGTLKWHGQVLSRAKKHGAELVDGN